MRANHYTLTPALVHHHARQRLQAFVPLADFSPLCTATLVWTILLAAAGARRSFSATCQRLRDAPSDETVRKALHATLTDRTRLQWQLNRALRGHLPKALKRKPQVIACDLHLIPYYGKPCRDDKELCRSRSQAGTTHFHSYATAYIVRAGQRFTVGLTYRTQGTPIRDLLKGLLQQVRRAGIRIKYVLLDRGFYSVAAIRYLQAARTPFMMPAKFSGRKPKPGQAPTGFRAWMRSGWGRHTLTEDARKKGQPVRRATVDICVVCLNLASRKSRRTGRPKKRGRHRWIYAMWGMPKRSFAWVRHTYRRRFGIETTYRQLNEGKIRTSTRRPEQRLLFVGLALLLRNIWVWLHYEVLASRRRGNRRLNLGRLRLRHLLEWLVHVAEETLGVLAWIEAEAPL